MTEEKPRILYVDDLPINLKLFEATFHNDYDITLSESPTEALMILEEKEIQVLVSDQRMPEMRGTELLEIVAERYPEIRRYLLTAFTDTDTVIEAVNKGKIHGYIKKPMQPDEIRQSINSSLEVYHLRMKNRHIMKELENANAELRNADHLKTEIINSISNEISPPLNRIMGTLHLLKSKIEGDELSDMVNILDHSVFKLEQFSMMAKQISVLKSPGFRLKENSVSLKQVIQFSSIETREELIEQGIALKRDKEQEDLTVNGDSALLVSCMVGLIRFAREHTERNGEIQVRIISRDGTVICNVEDQGVNYTDALFEILTSYLNEDETSMTLSMGIGLSVSRMIMEAHKGHLIFERTARDHGRLKMVFS